MNKNKTLKTKGKNLATPTSEKMNITVDASLKRCRCNRCNRTIILRYAGQEYGPICIKKIKTDPGSRNAKDENKGQTRPHSFGSTSEVV